MFISFRGAIMAGLIWGVIALVVGFLESLIPSLSTLIPTFGGLTLGLYAVMFASIHYTARTRGGLFEHLVGGILAAIIAGLLLMLASMFLIRTTASSDIGSGLIGVLLTGLLAGVFGALGMEVVNRLKL